MKQIVIKKWIDGEFREVKRYSEEEVVSIRHHTDGLEVILKGNIRLYDTQCIIEFEELKEESCYDRIRKDLITFLDDVLHRGKNADFEKYCKADCIDWMTWIKKQGEQINIENKEYCRGYIEGKQEILDKYADLEKQGEKKSKKLPNGEDYGIDSLYHAARILEKTLGEVDGYQSDDGILEHKCAIEAVNRLYKQKPAECSEEDEKIKQECIEKDL